MDFSAYLRPFFLSDFLTNLIPVRIKGSKATIFLTVLILPKTNHPIFKVFAFIATIIVLRLMRTAPIAGLSKIPYP